MSAFVSKGYIENNGVPFVSSDTLSLALDTGDNPVLTILQGMAGHSLGARVWKVSIGNPVRAEGFEVNWYALANAGGTHQLKFVFLKPETEGGGVMWWVLLEGFYENPKGDLAVSKPANASVDFQGRLVEYMA
jgi:hypothetical protein